MVKIKDLNNKQLEGQLQKYDKIISALKKEKMKRMSEAKPIREQIKRIKEVGTVTNIRPLKQMIEETRSNIFQLKFENEELALFNQASQKVKELPRQVTISKLIELGKCGNFKN